MGHGKLRHDNTCLNCGSVVRMRYCPNCGQENLEPRESIGGIISHFIADITHFDGKFFSTSKYLLTSPGFLPKEYMQGRRSRYLHPIRMYVFTSALFFFVFFSVFTVKDVGVDVNTPLSRLDSAIGAGDAGTADTAINSRMITEQGYSTVAGYDSAQRRLPAAKKDSWLERRMKIRQIELNSRYRSDAGLFIKDLLNRFYHSFPTLLFISLPLFALFLKWLHRRNKQLYYADHAIFLIYLYIFAFILALVLIGVNQLQDALSWDWLSWVWVIFLVSGMIYFFIAMRRFYGGKQSSTILKLFIFNILAGITLLALFGIFFLLSVFRV